MKYVCFSRFILEMFDTIASGIDALFERMGCDRDSVTKRLGNSSKVDTENILDFLLRIENQSNVLIRVFLTSQQDTIEVKSRCNRNYFRISVSQDVLSISLYSF